MANPRRTPKPENLRPHAGGVQLNARGGGAALMAGLSNLIIVLCSFPADATLARGAAEICATPGIQAVEIGTKIRK
jgi:hypothetical protein